MAEHPKQRYLPFPAQPEPQSVPINGRCTLRTQEGERVVSVGGLPFHHYRRDDRVAEAYAMVCLVRGGYATRVEIARAFGCSSRTVRRHLRRYAAHGMAGLDVHSGRKAGELRLSRRRLAVVSQIKASGGSNREIAQQLNVTENAIRKVVRRWIDPKPEAQQLSLPGFPSSPGRPDQLRPRGFWNGVWRELPPNDWLGFKTRTTA